MYESSALMIDTAYQMGRYPLSDKPTNKGLIYICARRAVSSLLVGILPHSYLTPPISLLARSTYILHSVLAIAPYLYILAVAPDVSIELGVTSYLKQGCAHGIIDGLFFSSAINGLIGRLLIHAIN